MRAGASEFTARRLRAAAAGGTPALRVAGIRGQRANAPV